MQGVCGLIMYEHRKMGVLMENHRKGEMCGAVSGALMVLGLLYGHSESDDLETKARSYTMADWKNIMKNYKFTPCTAQVRG